MLGATLISRFINSCDLLKGVSFLSDLNSEVKTDLHGNVVLKIDPPGSILACQNPTLERVFC